MGCPPDVKTTNPCARPGLFLLPESSLLLLHTARPTMRPCRSPFSASSGGTAAVFRSSPKWAEILGAIEGGSG
ncbi:hypothetical protein BRADI_2g27093v3 [Brachypodium distachyon]|uniref:Uncharacterized protein n=1 Tax=Brachypodium distachyon TaxID=15368 RepID=A0A2K2DAU1_BRADI|nr:hypothetical protein BRADI_2g27093v3 [Brachypodium distachyon]